MNISHSELTEIIKEEVARYKRIKLLENRKNEIIRQLNENKVCKECGSTYEESMYDESDEMVDEIFGKIFGKKDPQQKKAEMKEFILKHPTYRNVPGDVADKFDKDEKQVLEKLAEFFAEEGDIVDDQLKGVKSFVYDPKNDKFVNKTKVSVPYGPSTGKGEI